MILRDTREHNSRNLAGFHFADTRAELLSIHPSTIIVFN